MKTDRELVSQIVRARQVSEVRTAPVDGSAKKPKVI